MANKYRHLGKETPRKDAREIVTGRAQYFDDMSLPGMLYAKVLRSPYAHANIKHIDTSRAEALKGVKAVLTYKDTEGWEWGIPKHIRILDNKVRFVGDAVAMVAADNLDIAEDALELIKVEYEQLPAVYDVEEAIKPGQAQLYDQFPNNMFSEPLKYEPTIQRSIDMGDVEKGFAEADVITEGTCGYEIFPNPLPPEPPGVIATWEAEDRLTIYTPSQSIAYHRFLGLPFVHLADFRAISTQCGGSYGTKNANLTPVGYAALLSKAANRPVKVYYTKEEQFHAYSLRLGSRINAKVGLKKDGTVTAIEGQWLVNIGAASECGPYQVAVGCGELQIAVQCPNWNLKTGLVFTNYAPAGIVRGFGGQELESSFLPLVGLAMEKAGIDPVDFFKKNVVKKGGGWYWRDGKWWDFRGADFTKAIDRGAEVFGWKDKWHGWGKPTSVNGVKRRGVGVGVHSNADIGEDTSEAHVKLSPDGRVMLNTCHSDSGHGQRSSLCKMAAEVLNIPLENVKMSQPDTEVNPFEFALMGSRGTYAAGSAVIAAAEDARRKLLELAATKLGTTPDHLDTEDGIIYIIGRPDQRVPWRRVMGFTRTITGEGRFEPDYSLCNFLMTFVEIEVDTDTGKLELIDVVNATDAGQIISPMTLEGQLHGALGSAGLDTAIFEETVLDPKTGRMLNGNMIDYKWRTFVDLPSFTNVILETPVPSHRFGAIGVGEISTSPGPSAVQMGVYNAIGQRIMSYPLTSDKILKVLGKI